MLSIAEVRNVVNEIRCPGYKILVRQDARLFLQVEANAGAWQGRKWDLSQHKTHSEIVQTALKAVLTFEEHEIREKFTFHGRAIFGPNLNVYELIKLVDQGKRSLDPRTPPPAAASAPVAEISTEVAAPRPAAPVINTLNDL